LLTLDFCCRRGAATATAAVAVEFLAAREGVILIFFDVPPTPFFSNPLRLRSHPFNAANLRFSVGLRSSLSVVVVVEVDCCSVDLMAFGSAPAAFLAAAMMLDDDVVALYVIMDLFVSWTALLKQSNGDLCCNAEDRSWGVRMQSYHRRGDEYKKMLCISYVVILFYQFRIFFVGLNHLPIFWGGEVRMVPHGVVDIFISNVDAGGHLQSYRRRK